MKWSSLKYDFGGGGLGYSKEEAYGRRGRRQASAGRFADDTRPACALGHQACRDNYSVLYKCVPKLFTELALARGDSRYARLMRSLARIALLILNDWGLDPSTPPRAPTSTRYSKSATAAAPLSSPAGSRWTPGTRSLASRRRHDALLLDGMRRIEALSSAI